MAPPTHADDDPLSFALRPPVGESEQARRIRLQDEAHAKAISERIDEELRAEREALKRKRGANADVKLLLLGQAESGKSTLQKQFQLLYAPQSLEIERASWRPVVYLNVVKSVREIIEAIEGDEDSAYLSDRSTGDARRSRKAELYQQQLAHIKLRLRPLLSIEDALSEYISGAQFISSGSGPLVRSGWQFTRRMGRPVDNYHRQSFSSELDDSNTNTFQASVEDIVELWRHPAIRSMVKRQKIKLEDSAAFFLDEAPRIASPYYVPSTDDILRARLQTLGVAEHTFEMNMGRKSVTWRLYDVGGSRGQRHTWVPFFDDANAIIFLAPISAFNQYLEEDYKVNRIDDSLQTFTSICSNPLLKNVHLVLFLNKIDLLKQKLQAGLKVKKYITSFANRPNEYHEVSQYFRAHFLQTHRKHNVDNRRMLYCHLTSAVDTKTTQAIITNVRDSIFRGYLKDTSLV